MADRSILITGASTGIGRETALHFDRAGWKVFPGVRKPGDAEELRSVASDRIDPVIVDVTDQATIDAAREHVAANGNSLDALVNNAGIAVGGPVEGVPLERWRHQFEVNLFGQIAVTQAFLPLLRASHGRIIMVSSVSGRVSSAYLGAYSASKFALEAVSDSLRAELRRLGVHVSVVEPSPTESAIWGKVDREADDQRAAMTPEQVEVYGEHADRFVEAFKEFGRTQAVPTAKVVNAIDHAVTSKRPRTRYLIGVAGRGQVVGKALLPARTLDRASGRLMGNSS